MKKAELGGSLTILLPDRLDPNKKENQNKAPNISAMNPPSDTPESHTNGMTATTSKAPGSALRARSRQKKAPELQAVEKKNWLIHLLYIKKEFDECKKIIKEQLNDTRGMCEYANYVQGLILRHEGKIQESFELFQLCNMLNPSSVENIKQMARSLFLLGRHKLAIEAYAQAEAKTEKPDWEIHHNMGVCFVHLKDYESAKEQLSFALDHNKHHLTFTMLARIYQMENDVTSAISTFRVATEHFPENADVHTHLGLCYMHVGKYQQAFEHLGTALTFDPKNTKAILAAGSMMQSHQDYDVALSKYRIAAQSIPESPPLWNNIAMCFFGKKKYVAAISCLKRANYLAPFDWKILYNLGLVHLTMQQYASSFHFLSAAINLRPTKGQIFMLLAVTLTYLEDQENAKQAYEQAVTLESKDPNVCLNYAIFSYNTNDKEGAVKQYNEFETRIVRFRHTTGNDLDSEALEAGSKLASALGVTASVFSKRPKTRLQANLDPSHNDELQLDSSSPQDEAAPNENEGTDAEGGAPKTESSGSVPIPVIANSPVQELEDSPVEDSGNTPRKRTDSMETNAEIDNNSTTNNEDEVEEGAAPFNDDNQVEDESTPTNDDNQAENVSTPTNNDNQFEDETGSSADNNYSEKFVKMLDEDLV